MRILIVEDEPTLGKQLKSTLEQNGYAVDLSVDGEDGHFMGSTEEYDAVVLDLGLPDKPGLEVLKAWRAAGSRLPVVVSHGEGRADFEQANDLVAARVALRYIEGNGEVATRYPLNPNGSPEGITGLTSDDGRSTILMPHPERTLRSVNLSWHPAEWKEESPWLRMFRNARHWVG